MTEQMFSNICALVLCVFLMIFAGWIAWLEKRGKK